MKRYLFSCLLVLGSSLITHHSLLAQEVRWRTDYNAARREARDKSRPLLLNFGTQACSWCQRLDATTFRDTALVGVLNERLVPLKVDAGQNAALVEVLRIQAYPTLILADPDGRIVETVEGYVEAGRLSDLMQRLLTSADGPEWMHRDCQDAMAAHRAADSSRAVALLKGILQDGKARPIQTKARRLLQEIEAQAAAQLKRFQELAEQGQIVAACEGLPEFLRTFTGTPAVLEGARLLTTLAERSEVKARHRECRARDLLAQAHADFRTRRYLACLDRCDALATGFAGLPECAEARELANAIRACPERLEHLCENLAEQLGTSYLTLAETLVREGQAQRAARILERVAHMLPGTPQAETARQRLQTLQGLSSREAIEGNQP